MMNAVYQRASYWYWRDRYGQEVGPYRYEANARDARTRYLDVFKGE